MTRHEAEKIVCDHARYFPGQQKPYALRWPAGAAPLVADDTRELVDLLLARENRKEQST